MQLTEILAKAAQAYEQNLRIERTQDRPHGDEGTTKQLPEHKDDATRRIAKVDAARSVLEPVERFAISVGVDLKFHVNADTGEMQAEVRDSSGHKVIRKVPADEVMRLAASIKELSHNFFDREL
ncbi:putative FlaG/YvyC family protein [Desulfobaculum xiamenense]|uniref:Putative FlaG/YvyC family protein n=1 Tax=Desulfobaculum xiamenense TaxID=995050 RepID=A0A846QJZ2_9BACT|nr:flagellar protein FlaG [Desulfobaculum xiamenense]NJB68461.1 putative FlaG/YvyC family protein [Desulfobaculum xiamenense]